MGRSKAQYYRNMHEQIYDRLSAMAAFGESKNQAKKDGTYEAKIFSFETFKTYRKQCNAFADYVRAEHPDCTTIKKAQKYVNEYIQKYIDSDSSAWTISTKYSALRKLYQIPLDSPDRIELPERHRADIKRSRTISKTHEAVAVENNAELIQFVKGTGLRLSGLKSIKGRDLLTREDIRTELAGCTDARRSAILRDASLFSDRYEFFIQTKEKGGKVRIAPIIGPDTDAIVARMKNTPPNKKVWPHIVSNSGLHRYRSVYACQLYKIYAKPIEQIIFKKIDYTSLTDKQDTKGNHITKSAVYYCRSDQKGVAYDRAAMILVSKALGHNRESVIAEDYLYNL